MKRTLLFITLAVIAGILSYQIAWFHLLLLFLMALLLIFLAIVTIIRFFRKTNKNLFTIPALLLCVCATGIIISLFKPYGNAIIHSKNVSKELEFAYQTDQKDRKTLKSYLDFSELNRRDELRLEQVKDLYRKGAISKSMDKFHAAFVFHHSDNSKDYEVASKLASEAAKDPNLKENYQVQWLAKAAYDRWMLSIGKPEKYNTQNKFSIEME